MSDFLYRLPADDHEYGMTDKAQHDIDLERAPGLTLADVDRLAREAYVAGYKAGHKEGVRSGYRKGRDAGERDGRAGVADAVTRVIRGRLNHVQRRMSVCMDRKRTTIAEERAYILREANELHIALTELAAIKGVER
jgi:hypothetical protein